MLLAWLAIAGALAPVVAAAAVGDAVALCEGCGTPVQFHNVGALASHTIFDRERAVTVVNPDTHIGMRVTLAHPDAAPDLLPDPSAPRGQACTVVHVGGNVFRIACGTAGAGAGASVSVDGGPLQLGDPVVVHPGVALLPLPASAWFASYQGVNRNALDGELQYAAYRAGPAAGLREICPIFNNGDSACFRVAGATSPADRHEPDSRSGDAGVAIDNHGAVIDYGAPGSRGAAGERWLSCALRSGRIVGCGMITR